MRYGWQFNVSHWAQLAAVCRAQEWKRTFLEDTYRRSVPTRPGVYMICASAKDGLATAGSADRLYKKLYNAVYVGQAVNLRRRFAQHVRGYGNVRKARAIFRRLDYWHTTTPKTELNALEQCLIDVLGPAANDRTVTARIGDPVPAGSVGSHVTRR